MATTALACFFKPFAVVLVTIAAAYALANLSASLSIARHRREPALFLLLPLVFATLHFSYGFGSLWGIAKLASSHQTAPLLTLLWEQVTRRRPLPERPTAERREA
jgi:hypothetical protein